MRLLIVNPNSSRQVTESISKSIGDLYSTSDVQLLWWTGPPSAPSYITSHAGEATSAAACMPEILRFKETPYDGVLIACFSNHPLVHILRESLPQRQPVVGIMEAAVIHALQLGGKYAVITTSRKWEPMLLEGLEGLGLAHRCVGVKAVLQTMSEVEDLSTDQIKNRLVEASRYMVEKRGAEILILGGAKFAGLESSIRAALPAIELVDAMKAGIELLSGLVRCQSKTSKAGIYAFE